MQLIPLGGSEYRKSYEDLSLAPEQVQVFQILNQSMENYPYAVVTRNSLFFKSDDNCSVVGDSLDGVNIAEACRNHDYCYRHLNHPMNSDEAYADFLSCNEKFTQDIVRICQESGKTCSLAKIYGKFLSKMSHIVFRKRQSAQAEMVRNLLIKLKDAPAQLQLLMKSDLFNLSSQIEGYRNYCTNSKRIRLGDIIPNPGEKSACDSFNLLSPSSEPHEESRVLARGI